MHSIVASSPELNNTLLKGACICTLTMCFHYYFTFCTMILSLYYQTHFLCLPVRSRTQTMAACLSKTHLLPRGRSLCWIWAPSHVCSGYLRQPMPVVDVSSELPLQHCVCVCMPAPSSSRLICKAAVCDGETLLHEGFQSPPSKPQQK